MKLSTATKQMIHVAIVESDPLRSIGFRALLESPCETSFFKKRNLLILLERLTRV